MKTGTRFDFEEDFEVLAPIGEGGNGKVYLVRNGEAFYAVKTSQSESAPKYFRNVHRKMKLLKSNYLTQSSELNGENVEYYTGETPFYVYDYVPGLTLHHLVDAAYCSCREIKFPIKYILILGILKGIAVIHENGLFHRDIKPGNIFIDQDFHPHLGDFDDISDSKETVKAHGTVNFLPPEAHFDRIPNSKGYDIYQFGGTLFEIITKEWPFNDRPELKQCDILDLIGEGKTDDRVENGIIKISEEDKPLYAIVRRCWENDYEMRPEAKDLFNEVYDLAKKQLSNEELKQVDDYLRKEDGPSYVCGTGDNVIRAIEKGFSTQWEEDAVFENPLKTVANKFGIEEGSEEDFLIAATYDAEEEPRVRCKYDYSLFSRKF